LRVRKVGKSALDRAPDPLCLGPFPENPAGLATFEVQVNSAEADGVDAPVADRREARTGRTSFADDPSSANGYVDTSRRTV
jgi:hypothetical protein